jgi:hypothetical protein
LIAARKSSARLKHGITIVNRKYSLLSTDYPLCRPQANSSFCASTKPHESASHSYKGSGVKLATSQKTENLHRRTLFDPDAGADAPPLGDKSISAKHDRRSQGSAGFG